MRQSSFLVRYWHCYRLAVVFWLVIRRKYILCCSECTAHMAAGDPNDKLLSCNDRNRMGVCSLTCKLGLDQSLPSMFESESQMLRTGSMKASWTDLNKADATWGRPVRGKTWMQEPSCMITLKPERCQALVDRVVDISSSPPRDQSSCMTAIGSSNEEHGVIIARAPIAAFLGHIVNCYQQQQGRQYTSGKDATSASKRMG